MKLLNIFSRKRPDSSGLLHSDYTKDWHQVLSHLEQDMKLEIEAILFANGLSDLAQLKEVISLELIRNASSHMVQLLSAKPCPNLYVVGSLFLYRCYQNLMRHDVEHLFYVTGSRIGNIRTLDHICEFEVEKATMVYASGSIKSTHMTLIDLEKFGHQVHALMHKHPGTGSGAIFPSTTDLQTHMRMERGGYPVIGAIFSEDGFIRLFSAKRDFEIKVYGEGVRHVEDKVFKIDKVC